jgi:serine/threonine-protein kinase
MHAQHLAPGTTVELGYGRLVVDARLGEGGMGVVHRAWLFHAPNGPRAGAPPELVAVKVLHPHTAVDRTIRALFLNEAEALRRLSHPNIVRFFDLFPLSGTEALVIEFVDGDTLEDVIGRHVARARLAGRSALPGMPFRRAWHYFQQLLGALASIHALGIVHRDVKPSNILIRKDGVVKLTDFGIARLVPSGTPGANTAALAPGTGPYMSPEQVLSHAIDGRSDLYSAAIVLFEMLAGTPPFPPDGRSEFAVRADQVNKAPPSLRTFVPQAPPVLDALFHRALAKDPAYRFGSAVEMGEAFRRALGIRDAPEWDALAEIAREASAPTEPASDPASAPRAAARAQRIATLRDFVLERYRTSPLAAVGPR